MLVRKTVTVLFCDVVRSTETGERFDPESWRRVMSRYFDEMQAVIQRHGGTVEKFIGDEVMAVFGVPAVHEDDALRAVRAAAEMRDRLAELNAELEATWDVRLQMRVGVNTGEVVAGDPATGSTFVTGDAVNVGKRLQQAAAPGEILIGKATYPLVRDAVSAGPLESFAVKGKSQPVAPLRLEHVEAGAAGLARRLDTPLVGRRAELRRLREAFDATASGNACHLFTILGPAGIGKSRLVAELVTSLGDGATALTGRCLPYGDGITFWPLTEILRGIDLDAVLRGTDDAAAVADRVRAAVGASASGGGAEETFWAVRRLFEAVARPRPLVLCFEDIHWAEPTLLDLIEYLSGWIRDAPVLLLCLARPDLFEIRASWATPRANASLLGLERLSPAESDQLLDALGGTSELSGRTRVRIAEAAEGNPLFVEQMLAMVAEEGPDAAEVAVPPSIQALLAERLDRLGSGERAVIERAAVVGKEFPRGAVVELSPPELRDAVGSHLLVLVRKDLIQPDRSSFAQEDGFRFRHSLIRDAAYDGIPKEVRADLHARFAEWIERNRGERAGELEEIRGYHFEQAFLNRAQLGPVDENGRALAARGASLLGSAGRRAYDRGDMPAAASLLTRATVLLRDDDERRLTLTAELGAALIATGELAQAEAVLDRGVELARALGDTARESRALLERAHLRLETEADGAARAADEVERALAAFEAVGDDLGLARGHQLLAYLVSLRGQYAAAESILERALAHAERAGARRQRASILIALGHALYAGPTRVEDAIDACRAVLARPGGDITLEAGTLALLAGLQARLGAFDAARDDAARSKAVFADIGASVWLAYAQTYAGFVELLAGRPADAEVDLVAAYETLEAAGARTELSNTAAYLAEARLAKDRLDDAEEFARRSQTAASGSDSYAQVTWRRVLARVLAARSELADAEDVAREAVRIAGATDSLEAHADALRALAGVLLLRDDGSEAAVLLERALVLYEAKGNRIAAERLRSVVQTAAAAQGTP